MTRAGRELALAVLLCLVGAGLALFAATRTWAVELTARPAPLPPLRTARTGADLAPWLSGLAVVGLAGAGALLATRRLPRIAVGVLVGLCGVGVVVGAVAAGGWAGWPVACGLGGLALLAGGGLAAARGARWPALGARYERRTPGPIGPSTVAAWDALDRGEDPTDRPRAGEDPAGGRPGAGEDPAGGRPGATGEDPAGGRPGAGDEDPSPG
jgi:hypothetical protein